MKRRKKDRKMKQKGGRKVEEGGRGKKIKEGDGGRQGRERRVEEDES